MVLGYHFRYNHINLSYKIVHVNQKKWLLCGKWNCMSVIASGASRKCFPGEIPLCVPSNSCAPQKNSKLHLEVDLYHLNGCIVLNVFHNEGIDVVTQLIEPQDRLCSIDLWNRYHHVPTHCMDQTYLGIMWKGCYYKWQVLPFGLKCSRYYLYKTVHPVIQFLQEQGIRIVWYVDDMLLMCTDQCITDHIECVLQSLVELGFEVNCEKSKLEGNTCIEYVGFLVHTDSGVPWIMVPAAPVHKFRKTH